MIVRTVHLPQVYGVIGATGSGSLSPDSSMDYRPVLLETLLNEPCVILLDEGGVEGPLFQQMLWHLDALPSRHRKQTRSLLMQLKKQGRLIARQVRGVETEPLINDLIARERPDLVVVPNGACASHFPSTPCAIPAEALIRILGMVRDRRAFSTRVAAGCTPITPSTFEARVWRPFFADATDVRLYDRYVGRSFETSYRPGIATYRDGAASFARTLSWMVKQFAQFSRSGRQRRFTINTELRDAYKPETRDLAEMLHEFSRELGKESPAIDVKMCVRCWNKESEHGRYLFANHAHLRFDPGFDFMSADGRSLGVVSVETFFGDAGLIESAFSRQLEAPHRVLA